MKPITYFSLPLFLVFSTLAYSQSSGIDAALNKGNAADLGIFFAEKLDVSILDFDGSLSSDEAVSRISDFFSKNTVRGYKRAHLTAATNGRSAYTLGDLSTSTGTYRTYLYYDSKQKISEIRIEK